MTQGSPHGAYSAYDCRGDAVGALVRADDANPQGMFEMIT
jgi:hypothetical protein